MDYIIILHSSFTTERIRLCTISITMSRFNYSHEAVEKKLNVFFNKLDWLQAYGGHEENSKESVKKTYLQIKLFLDLLKGEDYVFPRSDYCPHVDNFYMDTGKYGKERGLKEILSEYERKSRILKRIRKEESEEKARMLQDPLMLLK